MHAYFSALSSKLDKRKSLYLDITDSINGLWAKLTYNWILDKEKLKPDKLFERASEGGAIRRQ